MFHSMTAQDAEDVIHALRKVLIHYQGKYEGKGGAGICSRDQAIKMDDVQNFRPAGCRALIVGCGSIGRQHARNLVSLGAAAWFSRHQR